MHAIILAATLLASPGPTAEGATFSGAVRPFLEKHCLDCHNAEKRKGGLAFDGFKDEASVLKDSAAWGKIVEMLRSGKMPPKARPRPEKTESEAVAAWAAAKLAAVDCSGAIDPGRVTIRRLNRAEYNNSIRELLGIDPRLADDFPSDDVGYGFDNIGDVLSLPPILAEKYLAAAEAAAARAIVADPAAWKGELPTSHRRIIICDGTKGSRVDCARKILKPLLDRAYRRPASKGELERYVSLFRNGIGEGETFERGIQLALEAILVSPRFLFRVEDDDSAPLRGNVRQVGPYELAARLSYFLWSSLPDDDLVALAASGEIEKDEVLEAQTRRMLADPRARSLTEEFAGQWLGLRNLRNSSPDPKLFPAFDDALRASMLRETELCFEAILRENRSILEFLDADFTFLDERLARHYGLAGVSGNEFRRVSLAVSADPKPGAPPAAGVARPDRRGGLLTQASILTLTSNPTRTSPVKRGRWILDQILGAPPPAPPPNVPPLEEGAQEELRGTLRQRMEQHRAKPDCAVCHDRMDPLGFAFENYDAVGAWREKDGQFPIDPAGALPSGKSFHGPAELKAILLESRGDFARALAERLLTFALGRGLEYPDHCAVDRIARAAQADGYRFQSMFLEVVKSVPFRMKRGPGKRL